MEDITAMIKDAIDEMKGRGSYGIVFDDLLNSFLIHSDLYSGRQGTVVVSSVQRDVPVLHFTPQQAKIMGLLMILESVHVETKLSKEASQ